MSSYRLGHGRILAQKVYDIMQGSISPCPAVLARG